ncbi:hypothetical protein EV421DRAFT_90697 [Armillaria borealis]|uniref:Uncharacterized protein n=1 Tax=Armillaria borealis TaxID=47425 RepID=A0AA39KB70_9AGAR|nr:hypothetical protein EV421DRAFT_90697 [Armillaria borealis]
MEVPMIAAVMGMRVRANMVLWMLKRRLFPLSLVLSIALPRAGAGRVILFGFNTQCASRCFSTPVDYESTYNE